MYSSSSNISQYNLNTSNNNDDIEPTKKPNSDKEVRQNPVYMSPIINNNIYSKFMYQNLSNQNIRRIELSPPTSTVSAQQKINLDMVLSNNIDSEEERKEIYCDDKKHTK
jgi:hypothetical protein